MILGKNNTKEVEEEVIAECYDDDDINDNSGSDSQDSEEENDKPDPKVLDKFKVNIVYINSINIITIKFVHINFMCRVIMVVQISQMFITNVQSFVNNNGETV